jgi:hypothetical protein
MLRIVSALPHCNIKNWLHYVVNALFLCSIISKPKSLQGTSTHALTPAFSNPGIQAATCFCIFSTNSYTAKKHFLKDQEAVPTFTFD